MKISLSALVVFAFAAPAFAATDTVFESFDGPNYGKWTVEGEAFGSGPATGTLPNQMPVAGFEGKGYASSYHGGDNSQGRLISQKFRINNDFIRFLIGGGGFDSETCINLVVDDRTVRTATGPNTQPGGSEAMELLGWDVREFRGKDAQIEIVDAASGGWGHVTVDEIVFTDKPLPTTNKDVITTQTATQNWLNFPVRRGAPKRVVTVSVDGREVRRFDIELANGKPEWLAPLDIREWKGDKLEIKVNELRSDSEALKNITQSTDVPDRATLYREPLRPGFHFSSARGWLNDPNGLVHYNGEYHLFYQHNPYGWEWGNMHWGHAVSKDLIHWKEMGEALYPDKLGTMFSGSAVVDWKNTSGFGKNGKPPVVLAYTAAGEPFTQGIAYSNDGRTFTKYEGNPVVENITRGNRDPKIIWHEPTKKWVMALWGEEEGRHLMMFLVSDDLKKWELASKFPGGLGDDRYLHECPDIFELPVKGTDLKRWVILGANNQYAVGTFDGREFHAEEEKLQDTIGGTSYAAQSFSDVPDGRRIQIGWMRAESPGMTFNNSMSIPMELGLTKTPEGIRLTRAPIRELESLRKATHSLGALELKPGSANPAQGVEAELVEVRTSFEATAPDTKLRFVVRGVVIEYDSAKSELSVNGKTTRVAAGPQNFIFFLDRTSSEAFVSNGTIYIPDSVRPDAANRAINISVERGAVKFSNLDIYELSGAW